jgi:YidC/Oxa1 family membrane protein insertase
VDQRRWLSFIAVTSVIYILFYLLYLAPYQKKLEQYRKEHPELFSRTTSTTETLTVTTGTLPSLRPGVEPTSLPVVAEQRPTTSTTESQSAEIIIHTNLYRVVLTSRGGRPTSWQYFDRMSGQSEPEVIEMIPRRPDLPERERELPFEVIVKESNRVEYPAFNTSVYQYQIAASDGGSTEVIFTSPEIQQLQLAKTYQFRRDGYLTHFRVALRNLGEKAPCQVDDDGRGLGIAWGPGVGEFKTEDQRYSKYFLYTIYETPNGVGYAAPTGPASDESGGRSGQYRGEVGWAGVTDKFFMAAVIPDRFKATAVQNLVRMKNKYPTQKNDQSEALRSPPFTIVLYNDKFTVEPRREAAFDYDIFVGPKRPAVLREVGKQSRSDLDRVLFYSSYRWMRLLKIGLMHSLNFLYSSVRSYGVAIVILTVLIRLVMHPLAHKGMKLQAKSMAEMQKIKPLLDELNRKYKGDPTKKNQEMMRLYKEHGISPLAPLRGCLPMLVQLPIFFALYSLLNESIDLRGASFLWIRDLAGPDKLVDLTRYGWDFRIPIVGWHVTALNLLPILMGVSQYFMSKLTPTPTRDPQQKQMMVIFTIMFPVMLYNFPSGLFIYWLINNVWQSVHQLIANRSVAKPPESGVAVAKA